MRLRTEIRLGISILVFVQVLTSLGAVGVLDRMGPSIARILSENVASTQAAEDMLAALTRPPLDAEASARFDDALQRAEQNVTEEAERPLLQVARQHGPAALGGDLQARSQVTEALLALARVNREAMVQADEAARIQSRAGAWAAVSLGILSYGLSVFVSRRMRDRLADPLRELDDTLASVRRGELRRRCQLQDAPIEVQRVAAEINRLLDEVLMPPSSQVERDRELERGALNHLLDRLGYPALLVDSSGGVAAANSQALELGTLDMLKGRFGSEDWERVELGGRGALLTRPGARSA